MRCILLVLALCLAGCAGSGTISQEPPTTLADVNRLLENREVRIERMDGTVISAYDVTVDRDSTRFASRSGPPVLPTADVRRITYERDRISPGGGAMGGAAIGATFIGLALLSTESPTPLELVGGGVIVVAGAVLGLLVGMLDEAGEQERVAYEGPASQYER